MLLKNYKNVIHLITYNKLCILKKKKKFINNPIKYKNIIGIVINTLLYTHLIRNTTFKLKTLFNLKKKIIIVNKIL